MSFRDTFTRNNSSSENLQYDDTAAYHFLTTMLIIVGVPLFYNILKTLINPFGHIPKLKQLEKQPQFTKKIVKFRKENNLKFITCWFIVKLFLCFFVFFGLVHCFLVLRQKGDTMKGFDPYEILEVQTDASLEKIKKSYRKLALKFHPDRNQDDPQANAKFIMISKAYQCLTDDTKKQNCLKFGNPEGASSFNVGIALPSILVKKQNQVVIMGIVFVIVVIVLPIFLIYYFGQVNKYDEFGMLQESHPLVHGMLHQHLSIKDCVKTMSVCAEFKNFKTTKPQVEKLQLLLKQSEEEYTKMFLKKNFLSYIKKSIVLIDARITQKKVPIQLVEDLKIIMKNVPILIKSTIMASLERSNQLIAKYRPQAFVGAHAIGSLIMFGQFFIQGKSVDSESFEQLDLLQEQIQKICKKKKKRSLNLNQLFKNQEEKQFLLSVINPERQKYISDMIAYIPRIEEMEIIVHSAGDKQLTNMDNIEVITNIKSSRMGSFCNAIQYPFLKMEGWWVLVSDRNYVVHLEHFGFDASGSFSVKFYRGAYRDPGNYALTVKIFSDCYFGLDIQKTVKFTIKQAKKMQNQTTTQENIEQDQSFFQRLMKSVVPQEEEELSDREDEEDTKKVKASKAMKQQKQIEIVQKNQ